MRSLFIAVVSFCVLFATLGTSHAVGLYVVGKEDCNCSPLTERGIVPDTLNTLKEAFVLPQLVAALDRIGIEVKNFISSIGAPPAHAAEPEKTPEVTNGDKDKPVVDTPPAKEEKPAAEVKPTKTKQASQVKKASDKPKKKRVRVPPRAM